MDPLDRLEAKVDRVLSEQSRQGAVLEEHQRRSLANEQNLELLRKDFAPLKLHVAVVAALVKGLGVIGTLVGIAVGVSKLMGWG